MGNTLCCQSISEYMAGYGNIRLEEGEGTGTTRDFLQQRRLYVDVDDANDVEFESLLAANATSPTSPSAFSLQSGFLSGKPFFRRPSAPTGEENLQEESFLYASRADEHNQAEMVNPDHLHSLLPVNEEETVVVDNVIEAGQGGLRPVKHGHLPLPEINVDPRFAATCRFPGSGDGSSVYSFDPDSAEGNHPGYTNPLGGTVSGENHRTSSPALSSSRELSEFSGGSQRTGSAEYNPYAIPGDDGFSDEDLEVPDMVEAPTQDAGRDEPASEGEGEKMKEYRENPFVEESPVKNEPTQAPPTFNLISSSPPKLHITSHTVGEVDDGFGPFKTSGDDA